MSEWHGYKMLGKTLFIGPLPGRKSIALWVDDGKGSICALAFFQSEEKAREALKL